MTDIFISYATEDKDRVRPLAHALAAEGWTVFWDRKVRAGEIWQQVIGEHLERARCVLVVWTHQSVQRHWVIEEANEGRDRDVLVPASLDAVAIPFGFRRIQSADLVGWDGDPTSQGFQDLLASLVVKLGPPRDTEAEGVQETIDSDDALEAPESEAAPAQVKPAEAAATTPPPAPEIDGPPSKPPKPRRKLWAWLGGLSISLAMAWMAFTLLDPATLPKLPDKVRIEAGTFQMGGNGESEEKPIHSVTFAKPFAIGRYEVTFDEYDRFAQATGAKLPEDEGWGRGSRPVINVAWNDAVAYATWLSEKTGKKYRLPSEAEWEYAARAGSTGAYWWGEDVRQKGKVWANCSGCGSQWDDRQTAQVGSFLANAFGLFDTAGNVWEWVADCYHVDYKGAPMDGQAWEDGTECRSDRRVIRGGSWFNRPADLRSANRSWNFPGNRNYFQGFRLAQDLE